MIKHFECILFVKDQHLSRDFYKSVLHCDPVTDVPGMTEFSITENCKLGLLQQHNAAHILQIEISRLQQANGIPRCELYIVVDDPSEYLQRAVTAGAKKISDPLRRDWGDIAAYCADPDGHIIAFAGK